MSALPPDPTPRQREVLRFIHRYIRAAGYPPSIREACEEFGVSSTNAMADHFGALSRKGLIARDANVARGVRITPAGQTWVLR